MLLRARPSRLAGLCLLFIGDGCLAWLRPLCGGRSEYARLGQSEHEEHELQPLSRGADDEDDDEERVVDGSENVEARHARNGSAAAPQGSLLERSDREKQQLQIEIPRPPPVSATEAAARIREVQLLLEQGLVSQAEYDAKKRELLARM